MPRERVEVVPNGIEPPARAGDAAAGRARLAAGARPVLLSVATHLPHKNLGALVDGLALIARAERPLLAFAGHGTDRGELADRAGSAASRPTCGCSARSPRGELEDLYAAASGLVSATRCGGVRAAGAGGDGARRARGLLGPARPARGGGRDWRSWLDPEDPASVAAAMRRLLGADDAGRAAAGRARIAARFTWAAAATRHRGGLRARRRRARPSRPARASA